LQLGQRKALVFGTDFDVSRTSTALFGRPTMTRVNDRLFLGVGGHVVAIDPATGEEIWRTKLKSTTVTTVWADGKRVYGGAQGELFCLDAASGSLLWHNKLTGLGMGIVAFPGNSLEAAVVAAAQAAAAASA
jgi:outer membrane protein assembly factor BamB